MRCLFSFVGALALAAFIGCGSETEPAEAKGEFTSVAGQQGEMAFGQSFVEPPKVELKALHGAPDQSTTIVAEVKTTGFRWKNTGTNNEPISWKASGRKKK